MKPLTWSLPAVLALAMGQAGPDDAEQPKVRTISWDEIGHSAKIVGKLGLPLGEICTVEGAWLEPGQEKAGLKPQFRVSEVNGNPLAEAALFDEDFVRPVVGGERVAIPRPGDTWMIRCAELGGYEGLPPELIQEASGKMIAQRHGYGFQTELRYTPASLKIARPGR